MGLFDTGHAVDIETITCVTCGITFGVPSAWNQKRRDDHKGFYCPNGHDLAYQGKSEAEKLRDQLAREKHLREQAEARAHTARLDAEHQERRVRGYQGQLGRTKRKIAAGRCPCCAHQFKDLAKHMKTEHPKYDPEKGAEALAGKINV